jgi:RNA polymerase-binding transcription factor DksA
MLNLSVVVADSAAKLEKIISGRVDTSSLLERTPSDLFEAVAVNLEKDRTATVIEKWRMKVMQAEVARRRIKEGSYEICAACGCVISEARHTAVPWTIFCVDCAGKLESGDSSMADFLEFREPDPPVSDRRVKFSYRE